jgi:hypothetical protein
MRKAEVMSIKYCDKQLWAERQDKTKLINRIICYYHINPSTRSI